MFPAARGGPLGSVGELEQPLSPLGPVLSYQKRPSGELRGPGGHFPQYSVLCLPGRWLCPGCWDFIAPWGVVSMEPAPLRLGLPGATAFLVLEPGLELVVSSSQAWWLPHVPHRLTGPGHCR
jgi:hypothetical protein